MVIYCTFDGSEPYLILKVFQRKIPVGNYHGIFFDNLGKQDFYVFPHLLHTVEVLFKNILVSLSASLSMLPVPL